MKNLRLLGVCGGLLTGLVSMAGAGLAQTYDGNNPPPSLYQSRQATADNSQGLSPRDAWRRYYEQQGQIAQPAARGRRSRAGASGGQDLSAPSPDLVQNQDLVQQDLVQNAVPAGRFGARRRGGGGFDGSVPTGTDGAADTTASALDAATAAPDAAAAPNPPLQGASFMFDLQRGRIVITCAQGDTTEACARGAVAVIGAALANGAASSAQPR